MEQAMTLMRRQTLMK
ncbi:unnamed protein product [Linum tenue]|uniref:Uncharacterized protein n=1 Tax=Linum tenue TaxID=586396 RepID=A0AAV0KC45_9ROSI|nr:unnamed protein product [Linum tenue]